MAIEGRVLDPDGDPIAGASVTLVSPRLPDLPHRARGTDTTDGAGRFRFDPEPSEAISHLVVEHAGTRLSYPVGRTGAPPFTGGDLSFAPHRVLRIVADCQREPIAGVRPERSVEVFVTWRGHELVYAALHAHGAPEPEVSELPLHPGHDIYVPLPQPEARHFEREIRLPPGRSQVRVGGGCGELETDVEVPASGPVPPLMLTLPG